MAVRLSYKAIGLGRLSFFSLIMATTVPKSKAADLMSGWRIPQEGDDDDRIVVASSSTKRSKKTSSKQARIALHDMPSQRFNSTNMVVTAGRNSAVPRVAAERYGGDRARGHHLFRVLAFPTTCRLRSNAIDCREIKD